MEELKLLIEMVSNLPALATWVLVGFLIYKVVVIGSVFGILKLIIEKLYSWAIKEPLPPPPTQFNLEGITLNESVAMGLRAQLSRLTDTLYLHERHVKILKDALDKALGDGK